MVGPERFALALVSEGRESVAGDWTVIARHDSFEEGFKAIASIGALAGWGSWQLVRLDRESRSALIRVQNSWEGRLRDNALSSFGSPFLAGKMAGYLSRLFNTNCWGEQTASIAKGDPYDEFLVRPSTRSIEDDLDSLLVADEATRADMAVALQKLKAEIRERQNAEQQLYIAMKSAKEANQAKSEFLANMSHEIRTPLTAIVGYTELLLGSSTISEQDMAYLRIVERNGRSLLRLIDDLLDLSKIEFRKLLPDWRRFTIESILTDVTATLGLKARQKGLFLDVRYMEGLPATILSDPARLTQVLMNLVGNAIKFTSKGGVTLTVAPKSSDGRTFVTFAVSDTGPGIPSSQLPSLFMQFAPGDQSLSKSYEGVGLGLAISKGLMEILGGRIVVTSVEGQGSTFTVWLDPGPTVQDSVPSVAVPEWQQLAEFPPLSGHVLVVEDVQDNRELLAVILGCFRLTFDFAKSGLEACRKVRQNPTAYMAILMDIQMPEMDGISATKRIRAMGWKKPIIAVTAYAKPEDRDRCLAAGCSGFLPKPISRPALYDALKEYLSPVACKMS